MLITPELTFTRSAGTLVTLGGAVYQARNNVASNSRGPWPIGIFTFQRYDPKPEGLEPDPEGPFGAHGILIFDVPGRTGMGLHAGRATSPDGLDRCGIDHCTEGCIRLWEADMAQLLGDPLYASGWTGCRLEVRE